LTPILGSGGAGGEHRRDGGEDDVGEDAICKPKRKPSHEIPL
jgi:hypothetical protein